MLHFSSFSSLKTPGSFGQGVYQLFLVFFWRLLYLKINLDNNEVNTKVSSKGGKTMPPFCEMSVLRRKIVGSRWIDRVLSITVVGLGSIQLIFLDFFPCL